MRWHIAFALALLGATPALGAHTPTPVTQCDVGPVTRNYGGAPWLVFSCHDQYRLLFVAPPVNPAHPGSIVLSRTGDGFHVDTISNGDRRAAVEAGQAIGGLSMEEFNALIAQTKAP